MNDDEQLASRLTREPTDNDLTVHYATGGTVVRRAENYVIGRTVCPIIRDMSGFKAFASARLAELVDAEPQAETPNRTTIYHIKDVQITEQLQCEIAAHNPRFVISTEVEDGPLTKEYLKSLLRPQEGKDEQDDN